MTRLKYKEIAEGYYKIAEIRQNIINLKEERIKIKDRYISALEKGLIFFSLLFIIISSVFTFSSYKLSKKPDCLIPIQENGSLADPMEQERDYYKQKYEELQTLLR